MSKEQVYKEALESIVAELRPVTNTASELKVFTIAREALKEWEQPEKTSLYDVMVTHAIFGSLIRYTTYAELDEALSFAKTIDCPKYASVWVEERVIWKI